MTAEENKRISLSFSASFDVTSNDENLSVESDVLDGDEVIVEPADPKDPESCARVVFELNIGKSDIAITTEPRNWEKLYREIAKAQYFLKSPDDKDTSPLATSQSCVQNNEG